jgi:hypothetical protein
VGPKNGVHVYRTTPPAGGLREWRRVSRSRPCPVCRRPDWCLFAGDPDNPTAAICARTESPKRCGEAGWLHVLRDDPLRSPRRTVRVAVPAIGAAKNWDQKARGWAEVVHAGALRSLAAELGLSVDSLRRLGIGWAGDYRAWSFPMRSGDGRVVGIRLRRPDGRKLSVKGGHEGLFIPHGITPGIRLLIAEGPTDTGALLDLGFAAVGRPSCTGGVKHLTELVSQRRPGEVVIVADRDAPGQRGAGNLASVLVAYVPGGVRVITPPAPHKDARAWAQTGATAADIQALIEAAPVRRLAVSVVRKEGGYYGF